MGSRMDESQSRAAKRYQVVGVRHDGTRDIRASNVTLETAEAVLSDAKKSGVFDRVSIEIQTAQ